MKLYFFISTVSDDGGKSFNEIETTFLIFLANLLSVWNHNTIKIVDKKTQLRQNVAKFKLFIRVKSIGTFLINHNENELLLNSSIFFKLNEPFYILAMAYIHIMCTDPYRRFNEWFCTYETKFMMDNVYPFSTTNMYFTLLW